VARLDFKPAQCPNCGGELQVPNGMDKAKCMYCGSEIVVKKAIELAAGKINIDSIVDLANTSFKLADYKEAYDYYNKVLEIDSKNYKAFWGKVLCSGWLKDDLMDIMFTETIELIQQAISKAPKKEKTNLLTTAMENLYDLVMVKYNDSVKNLNKEITSNNYDIFIKCSEKAIKSIDILNNYFDNRKSILENKLKIYNNYMKSFITNKPKYQNLYLPRIKMRKAKIAEKNILLEIKKINKREAEEEKQKKIIEKNEKKNRIREEKEIKAVEKAKRKIEAQEQKETLKSKKNRGIFKRNGK